MRLEDDSRLPPLKRGIMLLAGPAITIALCFAAITFAKNGILSQAIAGMLFMTNLSILMLNMLPVLPLDGGRLLTLVLEQFAKPSTVSRIMQGIGISAGVALIALNIWSAYHLGGWNLSLAFTGCCMIYSASTATMTHAMAELRFLMERKIRLERSGMSPSRCMLVLHNQTLRQLVQAIQPPQLMQYTIVEVGTMKTLGSLTEYDVISAYFTQPNMTCGSLLAAKQE